MATQHIVEHSQSVSPASPVNVTIRHPDVDFFELTGFLLKLTFAAIPSMIVIAIFGAIVSLCIAALGLAVSAPRF